MSGGNKQTSGRDSSSSSSLSANNGVSQRDPVLASCSSKCPLKQEIDFDIGVFPETHSPTPVSRVEEQIRRSILDLTSNRGPAKSICPSEVCRKIFPVTCWRYHMPVVRKVGFSLAEDGAILVCQRNQVISSSNFPEIRVTDEPVPETPRGSGDVTLSEDNFAIGDKVYDAEKNIGTVKYIGSVGKYPGRWLGIEWDDPSRGKHNGCLDDKEYFTCSKPNAGSFVRTHKAKKVCSIKEALEIRYGHDEAALSSIKSIEDRLERKKISYNQLRTLNLSSKGIEDSSEEDVNLIIRLCPIVEALELADNFLREWSFIGKLCAGYPKLSRIDFSKNPLSDITDEEVEELKNVFPQVDHVILGSVNLEWSCVLRLSVFWPKVSNLQVPFNRIVTLIPPTVTLMNVSRLDLEGNKITCWNEVLKLTAMERLEYINLCGNDLKTIRFPAEIGQVHATHTSFFPNLKSLNLTENSIDDWISISELNKLKKLEELRIDLNPVLNRDTRATNRQMLIARVGQIQKLEGVEINRQERRDAELDYVKKFSSQWEVERDSFRFAAENPRYIELMKKWGQSEIGENVTVSKTMKSSLLNVNLVPQKPSTHKPQMKKVVPTMNIQKLKGLIQRVFREDNPPAKIVAVSSRNPGITFELDDDFTDVASYSIEEGDKLLITW